MSDAGGRDGIRDAFAFVLFTLAALTLAMLAVSVADIPFSPAATRAAAALSLAAGWGMMHLQRRLIGAGTPPLRSPAPRPRAIFLATVPLVVATIYGALWFAAIVAPERSWDGNTYHLPTIHAWLQAGRIHWIDPRMPFADVMNGYPKHAELMDMVAVGLAGSSRLSHCQNLVFLPLGFLAVACLAQLAGVGKGGALLCGALFMLAPVNIAQSVTTYVDTAYACCVAAFLAVLGLAVERLRRTGAMPWGCLPLLGSAFGMAIGIRPTAVFLLPGALVALVALRPRRGADRRRASAGSAALLIAAAGLWGLGIGGFWYARNLSREGNPFYPVQISLFGKILFAGRDFESLGIAGQAGPAMNGWSRSRQILYAWEEGRSEWPSSILRVDSRTGGVGLLWLLGCVPSIFLVGLRVVRDPTAREEFAPLLACAGVVLIAFLATPENWWARYTVWIYAVGLPCFARVARDLFAGRGMRIAKGWVMACVAIAMVEGGIGTVEVLSQSYPGPRPLHPGEALRAANWRWPANYLYPGTRGSALDRVLAGSATVAFGPTLTDGACRVRNGMVGQLAQPAGVRRILPIPFQAGKVDLAGLSRGGAEYLIWDTGAMAPHCDPPEALLQLGSSWIQTDGFWVASMHGQGPPP